jgi:hypothetical protein
MDKEAMLGGDKSRDMMHMLALIGVCLTIIGILAAVFETNQNVERLSFPAECDLKPSCTIRNALINLEGPVQVLI